MSSIPQNLLCPPQVLAILQKSIHNILVRCLHAFIMLSLKTPLVKEPFFNYFCIPNSIIPKPYPQAPQRGAGKPQGLSWG